jgi:hypothetical protein
MPRYGRSAEDSRVASQLAALKNNPEFTAAMKVLLEAQAGETYEERLVGVLNLLFEEGPRGKRPKAKKAPTH